MLRAKIVTPARIRWGFHVVIARKSDGRPRFCVHYRAFNQHMKADKLPIPGVEQEVEDIAGGRVFSKVDVSAGCWEIRLWKHVQEIAATTSTYGSFRFCVMPFELINTLAMFQQMASKIFRDLS